MFHSVALALLLGMSPAEAVSPVQKVVQILEDIKMKVQADLAAEEKEMEEYTTFCDDTLTAKGFAIKDAARTITSLEAAIADGEATELVLGDEIAALGTEMATKERELDEKEAVRLKGKEVFQATEKELLESMDSLERAQMQLRRNSSFLQTRSAHRASGPSVASVKAAVLAVSRIIEASSVNLRQRRSLQGLLQSSNSSEEEDLDLQAPKAAAFESSSGGILETLDEMRVKAEDALSDSRRAEMNEQHSFQMMTQSLSDALKVSKDKLVSAKEEKQANNQELGRATGELARSQKAKKADEEYVESLTRDCKEAAEDWAERQASAKEEMAVIAKAQGILTDRVRVFVQTGVGHGAQAAHADDSESAPNAATRSRLVAKLKELSHKFRSYALVEVVTAAGADPFEKIKGLIEGMIEKLLSEANQEATQKSFCDEEIEKSKEAKDDKTMKSEKLSSRLEKAASNKARIRDLVHEWALDITSLDKRQAEATAIRQEERVSNAKASKDYKEAADAVTEAIELIRNFYEGSLAQVGSATASLARQPSFGAPKSDAASTIISILEMAGENFEKLYMETEQNEKMAEDEYRKLTEENKASRAAEIAEIKGLGSEFMSWEVATNNGKNDLDIVTKELDAILSYMDKLKPQCEVKRMSYAEKKARREAEIEGLKEALSIVEG